LSKNRTQEKKFAGEILREGSVQFWGDALWQVFVLSTWHGESLLLFNSEA